MSSSSSQQQSDDRCVGFNVSAPISELNRIEQARKKAGISRSEWIRRAAKHYYNNNSYAEK